MKLKKKTICIMAAAVVAVAGGTAIFSNMMGKHQMVKAAPKLPEVSRVTKGNLSQRISASGTTVPADEYSIFIELSQEVEKVYAEVGDMVSEGQLLVTYDIADQKKELTNKLEEAKITLQNAQISLNELAEPATGTELLDLQSQAATAEKNLADAQAELTAADTKISQAEDTLSKAKKTMENNETLLAVGGISQDEYDASVTAVKDAEAVLEEAKQSKTSKENSVPLLQIAVDKAKLNLEYGQDKLKDVSTANSYQKQQNTVKTAQMNIESIEDELSKLTESTYSPISGTIITSNAVEGQMLTDSTVMMKVADLTNIDLDAYVSEYDIAKIQVGQRVEMTSDGIEDKVYTGTVTKIEPVAESQSTISGSETVVPIQVHMDNADENVKPGFSFDMEIIVVDKDDAAYIPITAVRKDKDETNYVMKVDGDGKLVKTPVTLGVYSDMYVEITEGLSAEDTVVTSPEDSMTAGSLLQDYAQESAPAKEEKAETQEESSILDSVTGGAPSGGGPGGARGGGMPGGGR